MLKFDDYPEEAQGVVIGQRNHIRNLIKQKNELLKVIDDFKGDIRALLKANERLSTDIYVYRAEAVRVGRWMSALEEECEQKLEAIQTIQKEVDRLRRENKNLKLWMELKGVRKNVEKKRTKE